MMDPRDYDGPEPPSEWVRCLACGREVEKGWLVEHVVDECDGTPPYEDLEPTDLDRSSQNVDSETGSEGGQAKVSSSSSTSDGLTQEPAPSLPTTRGVRDA